MEVKIVSSHPLVIRFLRGLLPAGFSRPDGSGPEPISNAESLARQFGPAVFVIDMLSAPIPFSRLVHLLRLRSPNNKLVVVADPDGGDDVELLRLLYMGIDGVVRIAESLEHDLQDAVCAVISGDIWAPPGILARYVRQSNLLFDASVRLRLSLTARESQVLQLLIRRLSNREIAQVLNVAERTVKFHVSNIFEKLQVQDRKAVLKALCLASETGIAGS